MSPKTGQSRAHARGAIIKTVDSIGTLKQFSELEVLTRAGWILDTQFLYATCSFANNLANDAELYLQDVLDHLPGDYLKVAADSVINNPVNVHIFNFSARARAWFKSPEVSTDEKTRATVLDALRRFDFYGAALGRPEACLQAAMHAYGYTSREKNAVFYARYTAVALALLNRAHELSVGSQTVNAPLLQMRSSDWADKAMAHVHLAYATYGEYTQARTDLGLERDVVRDALSDLPDADGDGDALSGIFDLDAIDAALSASPLQVRLQPTIAVVPSLDHLPETKSANSSNPRGEFKSLSERDLETASVPDVHTVARELKAEMPWAAEAIEALLTDLVGAPYARFRPTLLLAKPGVGKTRLIRRLGALVGLPTFIYPASTAVDGSFGGTSRQWSTGRACTPLSSIRQSGRATVLVGLDELEKAGTGTHNGRLTDALIPFLELESAARYLDPYLECNVDLSGVSYVATANSTFALTGPLLDRFRVIEIGQPQREHLPVVAATILSEIRVERGDDETWLPDLGADELDLLGREWRGGSLRPLRRMIEVLISGRHAFAPRH